MPLERRRFLRLAAGSSLAVAAGGGLLTACTKPGLHKGGTLTVGVAAVPAVLNPVQATTPDVRWISDTVVETLYAYRDDTTLRPLLAAADPQPSPDGLTWTIPLTATARFHNGDAFTADHVVAVLNRVNDPTQSGAWAPQFAGRFASVTAAGPLSVRITLTQPYGLLKQLLACLPVPHSATLDQPRALVGTGPYVLGAITDKASGGTVTVERNAAYRLGPQSLQTIVFQAYPDPAKLAAALKDGPVALEPEVTVDQVRSLVRWDGHEAHAVPAPVAFAVLPNAARLPFSDLAARRALAYGMDRQKVRDVVFKGNAVLGQGPVGPATEGYDATYLPYGETVDPDQVSVALAEGTLSGPVRAAFIVDSSAPEAVATAQTLATTWNTVGFTVTVEPLAPDAYASRYAAGDYDLALRLQRPAYVTGRTAFTVLSPASSTSPDATGYRNDELDRLLVQAWQAVDASKRAKLCALANEIVVRDAVVLPPVYPKLLAGQTRSVESLDNSTLALGRVPIASLQLRS